MTYKKFCPSRNYVFVFRKKFFGLFFFFLIFDRIRLVRQHSSPMICDHRRQGLAGKNSIEIFFGIFRNAFILYIVIKSSVFDAFKERAFSESVLFSVFEAGTYQENVFLTSTMQGSLIAKIPILAVYASNIILANRMLAKSRLYNRLVE